MKQYKSLDLAKFIGAILIIVLHTAPFSSYSRALTFGFRHIVTIIAVPFFFVTSGFLAFKKYDGFEGKEERNNYILRYVKRLVVMYLFWSAVYFGFVVVKWIRQGFTIDCVLEYIKDFFFEGSYSTIWFLPALMSAVFFVVLFHKKLDYKKIFLCSCLIYLFTLGGSSYNGLVTQIPIFDKLYGLYYSFFDSIKNGLCFGLIFVSMGAWISQNEVKLECTSRVKIFIIMVVLACLLAVEAFVVAWMDWNIRGVDTLITLIPLSYFLMVFVLSFDLNLKSATCVMLRKYSILMFLCQRIPMSIIDLFMEKSAIKQNSLIYFATVLVATLALSSVIMKGAEKSRILKMVF